MQLFGTKGQKFLLCPGTSGQRDELKILQRDGPGQDSLSNSRTVQDFDSLSRPIHRDKGRQSRIGHSKTEKGCSKTVKGHSKTEKDILKQERMF